MAALWFWSGGPFRPLAEEAAGSSVPELSDHPKARRLYLRARTFPNNPGRSQIEAATEYLLEAVRLDPTFAAECRIIASTRTTGVAA